MGTTLLIVRHGQTEWNKEERFRGRADLALTPVGHRQARAVAGRVAAEFRPAAIYTSPLQRAAETAAAIGQAVDLSPDAADGLLDLDYGDFAGLTPAEAADRYPQLFRTWLAAPHTVHFPRGETLSNVEERAASLVDGLVARHADQQVVLVTHLVVCRVLLCHLLHLHLGHVNVLEVHPASLSVARVEQHTTAVVMVNDTCHLAGMA
jgi:broad specificity phosphatase PhoE